MYKLELGHDGADTKNAENYIYVVNQNINITPILRPQPFSSLRKAWVMHTGQLQFFLPH